MQNKRTVRTTTTTSSPARTADRFREIHEALWGGPLGEGLVYTVASQTEANAELRKSMDRLADALTRKADVVHGEDGEPISLRKVFDEIQSFKKFVQGVLIWLAVIGIATVVVLGRTFQILFEGHVH